jgi:excisionase family DNA binding protein
MQQRRAPCANPQRYLTVKEGAYIVGLSYGALYLRLTGVNPPPYVRRGKRWLLPRAEFQKWAEQKVIK